MRTFLLMLVLCVSGMAQELVGISAGRAYYIMIPAKTGQTVDFVGVISPYYNNKFIIDKNNHLLTAFTANCLTYEYTAKVFRNTIDGKVSVGEIKPVTLRAVKPQVIFSAIQRACKNSDGDYY